MKKLDWIFGNPSLFSSLLRAHSKFLPRDYFDNSVQLGTFVSQAHSQVDHDDFLDVVGIV